MRYRTYKSYLLDTYGKPAYRVGVDAGFSCPNRGTDRRGGCAYCDELGATAVYHRDDEQKLASAGEFLEHIGDGSSAGTMDMERRLQSIEQQITRGTAFLRRRYQAELYLLYFQSYSNTYGTIPELSAVYDAALSFEHFTEMIIATRPDCIDAARADLIASYRDRLSDVWVELGLQTSADETLRRIGRGHTVSQFTEAFHMLREAGISLSVHLMFGLPGEGDDRLLRTAELIRELHPEAVKIHNLHIPAGTRLYREYLEGELTAPSSQRHISQIITFLEHIPDDIIIQRLTCDTPAHRLAAPRAFTAKGRFISDLVQEMERRDARQGRLLCS